MKAARAFSPCHITGFFQIFDSSPNPLRVGSRGAGIALSRGIETSVTVKKALKDSMEIKINGVTQDSADVSKHVIKNTLSKSERRECLQIIVEHRVDVPIGAGFGSSGAAALSLALALNKALGLGKTRIEAAQIAHAAEVECKTGLGTVIAEVFGGVEVRTKPGAPGIGKIIQLPVPRNTVLACLAFGPLSTRESLTNPVTREHVMSLGGSLVDELADKPELSRFLKLSRQFAEHVGLISDKVRRILKDADTAGFTCSMPMFGESAFTLVERDHLEDLLNIFHKHSSGGSIITSEIDFEGARLLK